jgi:hypothetical protein
MKQILLINSSINGDKGHSVQLAQQFIRWILWIYTRRRCHILR